MIFDLDNISMLPRKVEVMPCPLYAAICKDFF